MLFFFILVAKSFSNLYLDFPCSLTRQFLASLYLLKAYIVAIIIPFPFSVLLSDGIILHASDIAELRLPVSFLALLTDINFRNASTIYSAKLVHDSVVSNPSIRLLQSTASRKSLDVM